MGLRVTQSMLARMALANLTRQRAQLARTQEQASSGLRINRPSDDPLGAGAALMLRAGLDGIAQLSRNASNASSRIAAVESSMASANDVLIRVRELAVAGANDTLDAGTRDLLASEVEGLHASLVSIANSRFGGSYAFAGFASDTAPFVASGPFVDTPPTAPSVGFAADSNEIEVPVEEAVRVRVSFDGRRIFLGDGDGDGAPDAGREDVFDVLTDLWDALKANDGAATAATLGRLDTSLEQLSLERTDMGGELARVEDAMERLAKREVGLATRLSEVEDADLAEVISNLVREETALQAGLAAAARVLPPTLMDFLA